MDRENRELEEDMSDQSSAKSTSASLQELPDEVILEIFRRSHKFNNLPLLNKRFKEVLKSGRKYKGEGGWKNTSIAMDIIETRFLVDFNRKLNFEQIQLSIVIQTFPRSS